MIVEGIQSRNIIAASQNLNLSGSERIEKSYRAEILENQNKMMINSSSKQSLNHDKFVNTYKESNLGDTILNNSEQANLN